MPQIVSNFLGHVQKKERFFCEIIFYLVNKYVIPSDKISDKFLFLNN